MKPIKINIKNPFAPIPARVKPARASLGPTLSKRTKLITIIREMVVFHPINTKGYYNGPERIDPRQLQMLDEESEEES
jgi:hypothetical protein